MDPRSSACRVGFFPALWVIAGLLLLSSCAAIQPAPVSPERLSGLQPFLVRGPLEPVQARGAAQFTYRGDTQSGELLLEGQPGPLFRVQLKARVTGSLALDIRISASDLLVIDYVHESYILGANTEDLRQELFALDLTPFDLELALTGRIPEAFFKTTGGTLTPAGAEFQAEGAEYHVKLDASGLPAEWTKTLHGAPVIRVEYRSYADVHAGSGPVVRMPERIRIYAGQPQPRLILGIQEWQLADGSPPISFIPPPEVLAKFKAE